MGREGAWLLLHNPLMVMNRLKKNEFDIFVSLVWSLLLKNRTNQN